MVESLAAGRSEEERMRGVEEYIEIGGFINGALQQQVEFDLSSFERASGRTLTETEKDEFRRVQLRANRWTYRHGHDTRASARNTRVADAKSAATNRKHLTRVLLKEPLPGVRRLVGALVPIGNAARARDKSGDKSPHSKEAH